VAWHRCGYLVLHQYSPTDWPDDFDAADAGQRPPAFAGAGGFDLLPLPARHRPHHPQERHVSDGPDSAETPPRPGGIVRGFLRLIVEVDESRRWTHRLRAALLLLTLLVGFGVLGYWVPEVIERYLH
jgi:hypothetical protein